MPVTSSQQLDNQMIEIELKAGELVGKLLKLNQIEIIVILTSWTLGLPMTSSQQLDNQLIEIEVKA